MNLSEIFAVFVLILKVLLILVPDKPDPGTCQDLQHLVR